MPKQLNYKFNYIENCNMCGTLSTNCNILGKRLNNSQGRKPYNKIGITTTICKCNKCGLIYSNPQPIPFDLQDHYGIAPEEYWNEEYFSVNDNYFKNEIEILKTLIEFKEGMNSLDIGAGLGKQMIALSNVGFDSYGFEASKTFYEKALTNVNIRADRLKLGMMEDVEYPDNHFDFISFGAVLEHLYDPSNSIEKALKWLKPNGIIQIEVPSSDWLINKFINFYYKCIQTDYVGNISPMHDPYHLYEFSLKSFQLNAEKNNYIIAHYDYHVCETYMPGIINYILKPYMKWTKTGMQLSIWLKKNN